MECWTLELRLFNDFGKEYRRRIDLSQDCIDTGMSPRTREHMDMAAEVGMPVPGMIFDTVITMMKRREFRRDLFLDAAKRLAGSMADYMEDSEGWHGLDRTEKVNKRHQCPITHPADGANDLKSQED